MHAKEVDIQLRLVGNNMLRLSQLLYSLNSVTIDNCMHAQDVDAWLQLFGRTTVAPWPKSSV